MKNKTFGLDIGTTNIRAVWLSHEKEGYFLESALSTVTPLKGILSEAQLDQEEVAKAIKKLLDDTQIQAKFVNIALPENQVYTKVIEMPVLSEKELASAIYWEAEQYIPVPLSTITLDYTVLSKPGKHDASVKMQVLLVGAPTKLIDKYEKILSLTGLTMVTVETEILSCIRALVHGENFPTSLIINLGALNTSLAIIKNGIVAFTYVIPTGGIAISRAIASDFGFSIVQAEEYKKTYGLSHDSLGGKIGKATEPVLLSILSEVRKAIAFFVDKYKDDPIKQILLSGGTAKLPGLAAFFTNDLNIETVIADPWKILAPQDVPKEIINNAAEYTIAVGLALREYE